jgi:DNA mismatch repair protein MutS
MQVEVIENPAADDANDRIVFTHRFIAGAATESYGIHVARLAGLPEDVIARATERLEHLTSMTALKGESEVNPQQVRTVPLPDLRPQIQNDGYSLLEDVAAEIEAFDINSCSPLEAMNQLAIWQKRIKGKGPAGSQNSGRSRTAGRDRNRQTMNELF